MTISQEILRGIYVNQLDQLRKVYSSLPDQGEVGRAPSTYLAISGIEPASVRTHGVDLARPISRASAREICSDPNVDAMAVYSVAMAWGAQNFEHFKSSQHHENIRKLIEELQTSDRSRGNDFQRAKELTAPVSGIGISYFTKLLYLCRPCSNAYILDQWTAKSLDVLMQDSPIKLASWGGPAAATTREAYEKYCLSVEEIAKLLGQDWSGEQAEAALFDKPRGAWRTHVRSSYESLEEPLPRNFHLIDRAKDSLRLAEAILEAHTLGADHGMNIPKSEIPALHAGETPRVYCGRTGAAEWYYWINKNAVRVGLFFPKGAVGEYEHLRHTLRLSPDSHNFGDGIAGNGHKGLVTRTISSNVERGSSKDPEDFQSFAEEAVRKMQDIYTLVCSQASHSSAPAS